MTDTTTTEDTAMSARVDLSPTEKTLTKRKEAAQAARRALDSYRRWAKKSESRAAIVQLLEAEAAIQRALHLETNGMYGNAEATAGSMLRMHRTGASR